MAQDLTAMTREELHDLRLDLRQAINHPGGEIDTDGSPEEEQTRKLYHDQLKQIEKILGTD